MNRLSRVLGLLAVALLAGCAPHAKYRTLYEACRGSDPEVACAQSALQEYRDPARPDADHLLAFVEFDDQGQLWDRRQMQAVLDRVHDDLARGDLLLVVFVHGWKHSAAPGDPNIATLRESLMRLGEVEAAISRKTGQPRREVVGVYLGWRGGSLEVPVLKELTFWDRKNTAHKVGHGGVTEVLSRLELAQRTRDTLDPSGKSRTRLVVVGHSFGGAVVYSALSQILEDRFVKTVGPAGRTGDPEGFGNLVVLINPAFEALRFSPLADMSAERGTYFPTQLPVLAILTSEDDDATGKAFPLGRWFSTLFEKERDVTRRNGATAQWETIDEGQASRKTVGHFSPYRTHELRAAQPPSDAGAEGAIRRFLDVRRAWEEDRPGSTLAFDGATLTRSATSAGRNPYLVIRVDGELIRDHNHIDDPRIAGFLRQLILIASQSADPRERTRSAESLAR